MNSGHTCLFQKVFFTIYLRARDTDALTLPHSAQRKHYFLEKIKEISKTNKLPSRNKIAIELLHQKLGHISIRSFMDGDTADVWEDIEFRIDTETFSPNVKFLK